jgi:heme/copper-type cytochrome/quinol oxidase subunit 2
MDVRERRWLFLLIAVFVVFNVVTLSPLVPWQKWLLWSQPTPNRTFAITVENYQFQLPPEGIEVRAGEYLEFTATSRDVTYGFGAFRKDGTLVFQMQVLPHMTNRLVWKFDVPGSYDVRSTEYSGPHHSEMFVPDAIRVIP